MRYKCIQAYSTSECPGLPLFLTGASGLYAMLISQTLCGRLFWRPYGKHRTLKALLCASNRDAIHDDYYITDNYITDNYITDNYITDYYITDNYITDN